MKTAVGDWLVLDEKLRPEWEREATRAVSGICGETITVEVGLPNLKDAQRSYERNENLYGTISWRDERGHAHGVYELLPFHGVFILNNPGSLHAQLAVWNSYLEPFPKKKDDGENESGGNAEIDDLTRRRLRTFPRQLLITLCRRMADAKEKGGIFSDGYWARTCLVPAATWLASRAALLRRSAPDNAADLMSQIACVRRYVVSRKGAMGYAPEKRMNHPSFDGRICPVDTPESEMTGLSLQLARGARVGKDGIIRPAESDETIDRISRGTALIPFSHNNDGARDMMGAKNLRQATPVAGREAPAVMTGAERDLAVETAPLMDAGVCPESRDANKTCIAMGRDLLTAYLPWNGWNLDDAIVVSESIAKDMSIVERKSFSRQVEARFTLKAAAKPGKISCGTVIAKFSDRKGREFVVRYNDERPAKLVSVKCPGVAGNAGGGAMQTLSYELEKEIPLGAGDKLMARHGNKGVVGRILPESEMPRLPDDKRLPKAMRGKTVEILVNPHGVLSRMNPGQLLETHLGWLFKAAGYGEDDVRAKGAKGCVGAPQVGLLDCGKIQDLLAKTGLDRSGKIKLDLPAGGKTRNPVVVGYEHFVRLHHIPEQKSQARAGGQGESYNSATLQPAHGRKVGGGQRLGEMEVWALCAHGADHVLEEMLGAKSDRDWSMDGTGTGRDADGNDKYGFTHLLRDWLRALCIDLEIDRKKGEARFSFLTDGEKLKAEIGGEGRRVVSGDASTTVKSGRFSCMEGKPGNVCGWSIPGEYPLPPDARRGAALKFGALLKALGYDGAGALEKAEGGLFSATLRKDGKNAGKLLVELNGYKERATTLNLVVSPSKNSRPEGWPDGKEFSQIHLRAEPMANKQEVETFELGLARRRQMPLPACCLLKELQREGTGRSIYGDFSVACPKHPTEKLKIGQSYGIEEHCAQGGLFDPAIFKGKDDWGFIELPESIEYPASVLPGKEVSTGKDGKKHKNATIKVIPVLPLHYRRILDKDALAARRNDISHYYQRIVVLCRAYGKTGATGAEKRRQKALAGIKRAVADLFGALAERLEKKHGFLRHEGLGRRVDRSFRLVITPNPELQWDQAGVPTSVLWEILGDQVEADEARDTADAQDATRAIERKAGWTWHKTPLPRDAYKRMTAFLGKHRDLVVLLNRQPSLHRDSIQAFHPVAIPPEEGEVLQLSPLCCEGFAADFDGDEMAGHYPVSAMAQEESRRILPSRNLRSIATGACMAHLDRDLVTGLELIHRAPGRYLEQIKDEFRKNGVEFDGEAERLLTGNSPKPGESGKKVFSHWCDNNPAEAAKKIGALSRVAFRACTDEGVSFGFFDLRDAGIEPSGDGTAGEWRIVDDGSPLAVMVNSGANGAKQIGQVVKARGKLEAVDGEINESLAGGMPWKAFFAASQNARSSMCQKKIGTQKAGHLTRQLVLALWRWTIVEEDCGGGENGRRSILTCKCARDGGHGICAKCFGKLPNGAGPWVGMPIGLIAAQSLGERGTQLSMRVFHTGGHEIDFGEVAKLMRGTDRKDDVNDFVEALKRGAYAKIDERYFQLLWMALNAVPEKKLSSIEGDPFAMLARGSQMKILWQHASEKKAIPLDSPFARVLFNLFGSRRDSNVKGMPGEVAE